MGDSVFGEATVRALFEDARPDSASHLTLGKDALRMKAELMRAFVDEVVTRSGQVCLCVERELTDNMSVSIDIILSCVIVWDEALKLGNHMCECLVCMSQVYIYVESV